MTPKDEAMRIIDSLPEGCTWEQIQYRLYVCAKVMRGLAAADRGEVVSLEQVKLMVSQWRKPDAT